MVEKWIEHYFDYDFVGFLDDEKKDGKTVAKLSALDDYLDGAFDFFVALGKNSLRKTVFEKIEAKKCRCISVIHPSAIVEPDVKLGRGVFIGALTYINSASVLGDNTYINNGCVIEHHNIIGSHCHVAPRVVTAGGVRINDLCLVGVGSVIMRGLTIGRNTLIGAASSVLEDTQENGVYYGNPAKYIRERD